MCNRIACQPGSGLVFFHPIRGVAVCCRRTVEATAASCWAASCFTSRHSDTASPKLRELATSANDASQIRPVQTHRPARKHGRQMPLQVLHGPVHGDPFDGLVFVRLVRRLDENTYRLLVGIPHIHFFCLTDG